MIVEEKNCYISTLNIQPQHNTPMSSKNTARSGSGTSRSKISTSRSRKSQQSTVPEVPIALAIDKFQPWTKALAKNGSNEKSVLIIKPDVVEEHEDDIIQFVEDFAEMRGFEIVECSRIQLIKEKAMNYCLATQEARAVEDERLANEEAERVAIEEENQRIEMERLTEERRAERQARRDAGDSDVEEDTVYDGNTSRTNRSNMTGRTNATSRTNATGGSGTKRTGRTTGRTGRSSTKGTARSGSKTSRQRAEEEAEKLRMEEEEIEKKLIARERISSFLCGGEIIVMLIEGKECASGLLELVGDDDPEYWPDFPDR